MKVKAKWAVKENGKWHMTGEVFETDSVGGLNGAVEVLDAGNKPAEVKAVKVEAEKAKPEAEPKPRTATRTRKKAIEK